ncbi:MAG: hypothetical protein GX567_12440 [Clostridia bacterium]|nr:hypothetical protein [Clostridia bacterium]
MKDKKMSRKQEDVHHSMLNYLEPFARQGVKIYVDGVCYDSEEAAKIIAVNEDTLYMADYLHDENGIMSEIHYDIVNDR